MSGRMVRILNAEPDGYAEEAREILRSLGELVERRMTQQALEAEISGYDVLVTRLGLSINAAVLSSPRLMAVVTATTGLDHIDTEAAAAYGVETLSLRGETAFLRDVPATAEHTWALLLALVRRVPQAFQSVLDGAWDRDRFRGTELRGKTLGLVGVGRVGTQVARFGLAFGMRVVGHDPAPETSVDGVEYVDSLDEVLRAADVVSLHAPLDDATVGLIGARELELMRPGTLLVNTSRGAVVDEAALIEALRSGRLAGAAVDVLAHERNARHSPLVAYARIHDNLIVTPHIGGATVESMARTEVFMARKLAHFLERRAVAHGEHA